MHPTKTKIVYCKDGKRKGTYGRCGMAVTAAQLAKIRDKLFLIQFRKELTMPSDSTDAAGNDDPLVTALNNMISDLLAHSPDKYDDLGVAVADFTKDPKAPRIWLHNSGNPWRIASTGKVSVLLAAVQLRDDVRLVKEVTNLTDPKAYDELFANPELWKPMDPWDNDVGFRNSEITHPTSKKDTPASHCPRPSTIFDLTKDPVDFRGPQIKDAAAKHAVALKLGWKPGKKPLMPELKWQNVPSFDFSELLWLMGDMSDNVAATACISEIGVAYLKAVQKAYGLFDPAKGAHLLLAGGYDSLKSVKVHGGGDAVLRPLKNTEQNHVMDALGTPGKYTDQSSKEPGSATALLAYLIALMQNRFVSFRNDLAHGVDKGTDACDTIRLNLSTGEEKDNGGSFPGTHSNIVQGIQAVAGTTVTRQLSKIGILYEDDGEPPPGLMCEFAFLETKQTSGKTMQYGVVVTGIRHDIETELGQHIHQTLLAS
jgi:hypothetical protein